MKAFCNLFQVVFLVFLLAGAIGCKAGRDVRKTLPDAGNADLDNSFLPALPFYASDTSIDGKKFTAIYLGNPAYDSLAMNIIHAYEPFAESVMLMVKQQHVKGILVDFRQNNSNASFETVYQVSQATDKITDKELNPVTIRFAWDDASSERAAGFMNILTASNHFSASEIHSGNSSFQKDKNCFTETRRGFEDN